MGEKNNHLSQCGILPRHTFLDFDTTKQGC